HRLAIQGDPDSVFKARAVLAKYIDIPYPQVRVDVWAIQVNAKSTRGGQKERAQGKMAEIREGISKTKVLMSAVIGSLANFAQDHIGNSVSDCSCWISKGELERSMKAVGFDISPNRPITLAETLLFLDMCRPETKGARDPIKEDLEQFVRASLNSTADAMGVHGDASKGGRSGNSALPALYQR